MNAAQLFVITSSALSILLYFVPKVREGERFFSPFPGMVAIRFKVSGKPSTMNKYERAILNSFVFMTILGMIIGYWILLQSLMPTKGSAVSVVPLIPGLTIPAELLLTLIWIIGLSMVVHEYSHYWACVKQGIRVKSAGLGWMLFFPIAFVEPDENDVMRKSTVERIRLYAAGPAVNLVLAGISILVLKLLTAPGIYVVGVEEGSPAWKAGIRPGDVILAVNGVKVGSLKELRSLIDDHPKLVVTILRNNQILKVIVNKGKSKLIGVFVVPFRPPSWALSLFNPGIFVQLINSLMWLNMVNMGLGVINALPMFITDGGKILLEVRGRLRGFSTALQTLTLLMFFMVLSKSLASLG